MLSILEPVIKWSGSKRSQAESIINYFPAEIDTYYEPFCGGASVLRKLLDSDIKVNRFICSDINEGLINLWIAVKNTPQELIAHYTKLWQALNIDDDKERKKRYFESVRTRYNKEKNPFDFMFIMRTTTNGMPRYNKRGEFNNSFHVTRNGINPKTLAKIVTEWSEVLNKHKVEFRCCSYDEIQPKKDDFVYLDPPYANTKGMYFGAISYDKFFAWLSEIPCKYALSFDGKSGEVDNTYEVPKSLYRKHIYIKSGNSSFKRIIGKTKNAVVYESLYIE